MACMGACTCGHPNGDINWGDPRVGPECGWGEVVGVVGVVRTWCLGLCSAVPRCSVCILASCLNMVARWPGLRQWPSSKGSYSSQI